MLIQHSAMPRIAAETMRAKYRDDSLRLVYPVGDWKFESAAGGFILSLKIPDGFEVAFALSRKDFAVMPNAMDDETHLHGTKERALNLRQHQIKIGEPNLKKRWT